MPWNDPAGRFSLLKAVVFVAVFVPAILLALQWQMHALGGRPLNELIHGAGDWTIRFLLLSLAVTPARAVWDWPRVLLLRRMLGVTAACYIIGHFSLYCVDQKFAFFTIVTEIVLRFYLTIGFVALLGLLALAITSTDGWQKRLRQNWKKLHRLVFPIGVLAFWHFFLQSKSDVSKPVFYFGLFLWLMFWRLAPKRLQRGLLLPAVLAPLSALAAAGAEAGWYGIVSHAPMLRVLESNLNFTFGFRPAVQVLFAGVLVFMIAAGRRLLRRRRQASAGVAA
jgi:sulfoxide reductase heme-binding subunit YedZ